MIQYGTGNLLEANVEALVNTVNCVGVMGKGIALQFKQAFPENYREYKEAAETGEIQLGRIFMFETGKREGPKYIVNFPTKRHWKEKSRISYIKSGLLALVEEVKIRGIRSIALPPLGCGNGGLRWEEVAPLMQAAFAALPDVDIMLFAPEGSPVSASMPVSTAKPKMTLGRSILISLMDRYKSQDYELTKLEIQKVAYFMQAAHQPLKLRFVRHKFGPYADNLNHALEPMEGHFIRGYGDRSTATEIQLLPNAAKEAFEFLQPYKEAIEKLALVTLLIEGFETPYGMELLSTVHLVACENPEAATDVEKAIADVHAWSEYKRKTFAAEHIRVAWNRLREQGWFEALCSSLDVKDKNGNPIMSNVSPSITHLDR